MEVRRRFFNECNGDPRLQKALAFTILLKERLGRTSIMCNYSINKIHILTKISPTTIKKYLPILIENGWVDFCGKNCQHLIVKKMCSGVKDRNIKVDKFCFDTFSDVYRSVRSFIALLIQARKDFVRRTIRIATDPQNGEDFKSARKLLKRLVKQGIAKGVYEKYKEYGLSLKRIAKETGNCIRTAQRTMKYAIEHGWAAKKHHFEQIFAPKISFRHVDGYTYSRKNNLYKIYANTYELNISLLADISHGNISW